MIILPKNIQYQYIFNVAHGIYWHELGIPSNQAALRTSTFQLLEISENSMEFHMIHVTLQDCLSSNCIYLYLSILYTYSHIVVLLIHHLCDYSNPHLFLENILDLNLQPPSLSQFSRHPTKKLRLDGWTLVNSLTSWGWYIVVISWNLPLFTGF